MSQLMAVNHAQFNVCLYHPSSLLEVCGFLIFGNTKSLYIRYIIIKHNGI